MHADEPEGRSWTRERGTACAGRSTFAGTGIHDEADRHPRRSTKVGERLVPGPMDDGARFQVNFQQRVMRCGLVTSKYGVIMHARHSPRNMASECCACLRRGAAGRVIVIE